MVKYKFKFLKERVLRNFQVYSKLNKGFERHNSKKKTRLKVKDWNGKEGKS